MAKRRREPDEEPEDDEETPQSKSRSGSSSGVIRISITLDPKVRHRVRLAAALADLEPNEWARVILAQAATRTANKFYPNA